MTTPSVPSHPELARRLNLGQAVVIGLGSMVGAGVFVVWGPAAWAAGEGLLLALGLALLAALCNATSTAQLAASTPTSGGAYVFGREHLGPWWGFAAGWCFVIGKTASCAAMALAFTSYVLPPGIPPMARGALAAGAVLALTAVSVRGITRTARAATVLLAVVLAALAVVLLAALTSPAAVVDGAVVDGVIAGSASAGGASVGDATPGGVLEAAGLLFFAFAGYARVATLGEEVREPRRTIPRAVLWSLGAAALIYAAVALVLLEGLGADALAGSRAPLRDLLEGRAGALPAVALGAVTVGAAAACLGAVLSVLAGISRTMLAMARNRDLPAVFAAVDPAHRVPARAQWAVALVVALAVLLVDVRGAIGFSSFGVLLYYAVANLAALRQHEGRMFPRALQVLGVALCVALAFSLPIASVVAGVAVLAVGLTGRALVLARRSRG